jgi:hypothetical protein
MRWELIYICNLHYSRYARPYWHSVLQLATARYFYGLNTYSALVRTCTRYSHPPMHQVPSPMPASGAPAGTYSYQVLLTAHAPGSLVRACTHFFNFYVLTTGTLILSCTSYSRSCLHQVTLTSSSSLILHQGRGKNLTMPVQIVLPTCRF